MAIPPSRLVLGSLGKGLNTYDQAFRVDNEAFPKLENALCWRGQLIKKPGSFQLGRLQRKIGVTDGTPSQNITIDARTTPVALQSGVSQFVIGAQTFTDPGVTSPNQVLNTSGGSITASLNRTTTVLTINGAGAGIDVIYIPGLPVMGIEEFESAKDSTTAVDFPQYVYFDTIYSYFFNGAIFTDNSFYKTTGATVYWTGGDFQQFDSCNYYRALWTTNNTAGAQFIKITNIAALGGPPSTQLNITTNPANNWVVGDVIFLNEISGMTQANGVTGVVAVPGNPATVTVPSNTYGAYTGGGIAQYLTNNSPTPMTSGVGDGIRWYDGQGSFPGSSSGFVNFCPPLASINPPSGTVISYLTGCRIIIPFGNRLLAIGTFETTVSTSGATVAYSTTYYGNRIRYCEVTATPFYANILPATIPANSFEANSWASNIQGFGGFIDLDTTERIISAAVTQGSLILGLEAEQRRMTVTGIETDPFSLAVINPEYGTAGTHAIIPMDKGILTVGEYGFLTTSSYAASRFDLPIIPQIFQLNPNNNGFERISGGRDFANEVVYFSYPSIFDPVDQSGSIFPDTTLVFNYRENSFSLWYESATTHGPVKLQQKTWSALTTFTWATWDLPWNAPATLSQYPFVAFGTPQGFVMLKWYYDSTNDPSISIQAISAKNTDDTYSFTSVNHNLFPGAYVGFFSPTSANPEFIGCVSHLGDGTGSNPSSIFSVNFDTNVTPAQIAAITAGTWEASVIDRPLVQTKQFQFAWSDAKKTRIGAQKYFANTTEFGEFTVEILGSQSPIPLNTNTTSNPQPSVISNAIVRTRPDDSIGINGSQSQQEQIWHRLASSCVGDTVQLQISFSDDQMRDVDIATSPWILQVIVLDLYPSRTLA